MSHTQIGPESAITERTTAVYRCTFTADGEVIAGGAIEAITAGLFDENGEAINDRDGDQNVLGANGGTLDGANFALVLDGDADTVAIGPRELQRRTLVLRVSHSDTGRLVHEVTFFIRNVATVSN